MSSLITASRWGGVIVIGGFCLLVVWQSLAGQVSFGALLSGYRDDGKRHISTGRVQFLVVTVLIAGQLIVRMIQNPAGVPTVNTISVAFFSSSAAIYLAEKIWAQFSNRRTRN